jgi:hypothetical protein
MKVMRSLIIIVLVWCVLGRTATYTGLIYSFGGSEPGSQMSVFSVQFDAFGRNISTPRIIFTGPSVVAETNLCGVGNSGKDKLYYSFGDAVVHDDVGQSHTNPSWDRILAFSGVEILVQTKQKYPKIVNMDSGDEYLVRFPIDSKWPVVFTEQIIIGRVGQGWGVYDRDTEITKSYYLGDNESPSGLWYNGTTHIMLVSTDSGYSLLSDGISTPIHNAPAIITTADFADGYIMASTDSGLIQISMDGYVSRKGDQVLSCLRVTYETV